MGIRAFKRHCWKEKKRKEIRMRRSWRRRRRKRREGKALIDGLIAAAIILFIFI